MGPKRRFYSDRRRGGPLTARVGAEPEKTASVACSVAAGFVPESEEPDSENIVCFSCRIREA